MTPHLIEIVLLMLAFFLVGCLIGYYVRRWTAGADQKHDPAPNVTPSSRNKAATDTASAEAEVPVVTETLTTEAEEASVPKPAAKKAAPASKAPAKKTAARKPAAIKPAAAAADTPELLSAPRDGKKDDLKNIKGIGPKIEGILNEKGIFHFDQIAAWKRKDINWVDNELSFKGRIDREEWVKQAKELVKTKG